MGAILFEGDEAAFAGRRAAEDHNASAMDETFTRRLAEARAFAHASMGLAAAAPHLSAKGGLWIWQRAAGWAFVAGFLWLAWSEPSATQATFVITLAIVFGLMIMMRLAAVLSAIFRPAPPPAQRIADDELPVLTILVPLYREAFVVTALIDALMKLDYPVEKLDVKILIEADDTPTLDAVLHAKPPSWFEIIPIPPGEPRTKPKALNYGLSFARGEIVAVFDAEDRPVPEQPRAVVAAFRAGARNLSVVQAPLLIHNGKDGWLARQFEVEYAIHFRIWLPFLARLHLPLALGGTSNYFRRDRLVKAGGWDAWNVTEDADLGLRLARFGGGAAVIDAPTWEEAPAHPMAWLDQRTRWMKGHLQTWLVLMRQPFRAVGGMGLVNFASVQLTLAGSLLASIMHAPLLVWLVLGLLAPDAAALEGWHAALFSVGYGSVIAAALVARATHAKIWTLVSLPLYWPLLSLAMLRALVDIKLRPSFWAKTPHG